MFRLWIIGLIVSIGLLTGLSVELNQTYTEAYDAYWASRHSLPFWLPTFDPDLTRVKNQASYNLEISQLATLGAFGLLLISLLARSIKQGRLVVLKSLPKVIFSKLKSLPKVIFSKQHFEGMTFFKWGVLIIGLIFALSFLEFVRNVTG